ncbi:MAG: alanine racemase [Propionibacteriaceae bacterium]|nr:alanine racemase [Propionibacteriaceae bacterium]
MEDYRPTRLEIDLDAIEHNCRWILAEYPGYEFYMGVIKGNCYGLGTPIIEALIRGGCNYLCVSMVEEALEVRALHPDIPILILVPISEAALPVARDANVCVTVATLEQAEQASAVSGLKVFIRANGGRDLFGGPRTRDGFEAVVRQIRQSDAVLEGLFLHLYDPEDEWSTYAEYAVFEEMTSGIDLSAIPVVSTSNSLSMPRYENKAYSNACRIGNIIYGIENDNPALKNCCTLLSEVTQIVELAAGSSISYGNAYTAVGADQLIGVIPIGFGDGFAKVNIGRDVFIRGRRYKVAAVTMDITLVVVDDSIIEGDEVQLIRDTRHLDEIAEHNHGVAEESICLLNKRVPRRY